MDNFYFIQDNHLCRKKNNEIKKCISLKEFSEEKKEEIVKIINKNYDSLSIEKYPSVMKKYYKIKNKKFIEVSWNIFKGEYETILYELEEEKKIDYNKKYHVNIFRGCELVKKDPELFYIIKYDNQNIGCYITKEDNTIIDNPIDVLNNYSLFVGENIGVDFESFKGFTKAEIRIFIRKYFKI